MMKAFNKISMAIFCFAFFFALTGCSRKDTSSPGPGPATLLSGVASKGLISGATITVYALDSSGTQGSVLATTITDTNGAYSVNLGSYTGNVLVVASGGSYIDEATGSTVTGVNVPVLRTAVPNVSATATAAVTPLTEIAVRKAGTLTSENIDEANALVANMIGGIDIITTMPANVLVSSQSTTTEKNYGLMLAAISEMVSSGTATTVTAAITSIVTDLADNQLNTTGASIETALNSFLGSANNNTELDAATTTLDESISDATIFTIGDGTAPRYSLADLDGIWYSIGLKTPVKNTNNAANLGYDVDQVIISSGTFTSATISTSDDSGTSTAAISVAGDGRVSIEGETEPHYIYMNASKDVMVELFTDPATGEQQIWADVKKASSYTAADLDGTWYSIGLKTPVKNTSNAANFGYDVDQVIINSGTFTSTTISTSDDSGTSTAAISVVGDGRVSIEGETEPHYIYMNASKDVMIELFTDPATGEQQIWFDVKKAASYTAADLVGTWYSIGLKTPVKNTSSSANFGYDVDQGVMNSSGAITSTTISTSDISSTSTGTISISSDGQVSFAGETEPHFIYMNASKNVMIELFANPVSGEQQIWIDIKQAQ